MNTGKFFQATEKYVNEVCGAFIMPSDEFKSIRLKHKGSAGMAFIRVVDCTDNTEYYDVTGYTLENICNLVARVVAGDETREQIITRDARKEVAKLFN